MMSIARKAQHVKDPYLLMRGHDLIVQPERIINVA